MAIKKTVTKKALPKAQNGKQVSGMYDFQNIYTGPDSTSPGVLKAQADKKKADANLLAYKKKIEAEKQIAIKKAQKPKMANGGSTQKCWPGYKKQGSKTGQSGKTVNNCVKK